MAAVEVRLSRSIGMLLAGVALFSAAFVSPAMAFDAKDALDVLGTLSVLAPHGAGASGPSPRSNPPRGGASKPVKAAKAPIAGLPPQGEKRLVATEVLVETQTAANATDLAGIGRRNRLTLAQSSVNVLLGAAVHRYLITDGRSVQAVITALAADPAVLFAQPNYVYVLTQQDTVAPPLPQYSVDLLHLAAAHERATGAAVRVGVLDTAVSDSNPELTNSIVDRFDPIGTVDGDNVSHGTAIAGIIAAHSQMVGVAPAAQIVSARAFTSQQGAAPASTSFVLLQGLDWIAGERTRIVNMSFAGPRDPLFLEEVKKVHDKGIVVIAAVGNDGPKAPPDYPAADSNVIGVTAIDDRDQLLPTANRGTYVALSAPGVDILVPQPDGGYATSSGTSMAAAHVSGIVALLLEENPAMSAPQLRQILTTTANHLGLTGMETLFGAGLVDPEKALTADLAIPKTARASPRPH